MIKPEKILENGFSRANNPVRALQERIWWRNILFLSGEQWFTITTSGGLKIIAPSTKNLPLPMVNVIRDYGRSMTAMLLNKDYKINVFPNTMDSNDQDAAEVATLILENLDNHLDESYDDEIEMFCSMGIITGLGWMRSYPLLGELVSRSYVPFSVYYDPYGRKLRDKRWVGCQEVLPRDIIEERYKKKLKGNYDDFAPEELYELKLSQLVASASTWKGNDIDFKGYMAAMEEDNDHVVLREIEYRPCADYPEGRHVVAAGRQIISDKPEMPIPVNDDDGSWYYSFTDFQYNLIPGRFGGDGGISDIIGHQVSINSIFKDLQHNRETVGRPYVITPTGTAYKRVNAAGDSYVHLETDVRRTGGVAPTVQHGTPLPNMVLNELDLLFRAVQDSAGDPKHVMRGKPPSSQASGIMVDILRDAAEQSHQQDINRFYRSKRRDARKRLMLAQALYHDRQIYAKMAGKGSSPQIKAFSGSEISGNFDVRMELTSGASATQAGKAQNIINLQQAGIFGDVSQNPKVQSAILKKMGLSDLVDSMNPHQARAEHENSIFANASDETDEPNELKIYAIPLPTGAETIGRILWAIKGIHAHARAGDEILTAGGFTTDDGFDDPIFHRDNHEIHIAEHMATLLSKETRDWPKPNRLALIAHIDAHQDVLMVQQAQQQQEQNNVPATQVQRQAGADKAIVSI